MAWTNKRKIHVARGNSTNIIGLNNTNTFTDGQPLFIKDRGYLGIAKDEQNAKNIMPIKVREVEGYGNEISGDTFTLNSSPTNHYLFTGDNDGTYLQSDNPLYFIKGNISPSNYSTNYIFALINRNNNDVIDVKAPITTNSNIDVGNNATLTSTNINVTYLKNANTPYITLGSSLVTLNQDTKLDDDKSFTSGYSTTLGTFANGAYSGTNNIYGATTIKGGTVELNSIGNTSPVKITGNLFELSAPTTLTDTITGKNNNTTTLTINPSDGTITGKSLYITSNGLSNGINYLSADNSGISLGGDLSLNNHAITGITSITASGVLTVNGTSTHTFKGDIDAANKTITCGTLEVNTINLHV